MNILEASGIYHSYDGKHEVLKGIDVVVQKGDFISILGASGSGKTTLLSILSGIEQPTRGKVLYGNTDLCNLSESKRAVLRRTAFGYVFQFFNLAPYLTVEENILLPVLLSGKGRKSVKHDLEELLDFLQIKAYRNSLPANISGGEQQRVAIGRGLIYKPQILFLDEPTGNLDSANGKAIMELLVNINAAYNTTILQVTHNEQNASYGNRTLHILDGKINQ